MKNILLFACFIFCTTFYACDKNNDSDNISVNSVSTTATAGTWRITLFSESGVNQTSNFSGYNFSFASSGVATATKTGSTTVTGSWSAGTDDSKVKFNLSFGSASPWEEISEDWHVLTLSNTRIQLQHISGGDGSIDLLTFEKN